MNVDLQPLVEVMRRTHGTDVSMYGDDFLARSVAKRRATVAAPSLDSYLEHLTQNRPEAHALLQSLNICYSEFFREPLTFTTLERLLLPRLAAARRDAGQSEIRVWSAACAAGQEAFSVAILLDDLGALQQPGIGFRVFATDRSDEALAQAGDALYGVEALQNVRLRHLEKYFTREGTAYRVCPAIRERVAFSRYDLLDEQTRTPPSSVYGDFDLVLCGNLLFYYRPEVRRAILGKLWGALSAGGFLMTGEAERALVESFAGFRALAPPAALFQKPA